MPSDWRKFHLDNAASLDPELRDRAVKFLTTHLAPVAERIRQEAQDPEWFAAHHFLGGMGVRNKLRMHGFGEKEFKIGNLDDYYVGLIELALGVTTLPAKSKEP